MTSASRLVPIGVVILVLAGVPLAAQRDGAAKPITYKTSVVCVLGERWFPFSAGIDRCFKEIMVNVAGKAEARTLVPKSSIACFENTVPTPRITFMYSSEPKAACILGGSPATKEQYSAALATLGPQEKAFFLKHVESAK